MLPQSLQRASYFLVSKMSSQSLQLWNELGIFGENFNEKVDKHGRLGCKTPTLQL
jgi:hypothetical protein